METHNNKLHHNNNNIRISFVKFEQHQSNRVSISKNSYLLVTRPGGAMVAQQTSNLKVVGSIPTSDAIFIIEILYFESDITAAYVIIISM